MKYLFILLGFAISPFSSKSQSGYDTKEYQDRWDSLTTRFEELVARKNIREKAFKKDVQIIDSLKKRRMRFLLIMEPEKTESDLMWKRATNEIDKLKKEDESDMEIFKQCIEEYHKLQVFFSGPESWAVTSPKENHRYRWFFYLTYSLGSARIGGVRY